MRIEDVRDLLARVAAGELSPPDAERQLRATPAYADLDFATIDHHREIRQGHPEIVYGPGKTPAQVGSKSSGSAFAVKPSIGPLSERTA